MYVVTGNGHFEAGRDYGDSALKLALRGNQLTVLDQFTPSDEQQLNSTDGDLGSGGPLLLPPTSDGRSQALFFGGKKGVLYVVDPQHMGGIQQNPNDPSAQKIALAKGIYSAPAYWNGNLYYYAEQTGLTDFAVRGGKLASTPRSQSNRTSRFSGATPTVSANGTRNGIVWFIETKAWNDRSGQAVLNAYDALDVMKQLYSSDQNEARDGAGEALRFTIPTVVGGHAYVGVKKAVAVYGLLPKN